MIRVAAPILALCGCARLFGLEPVTPTDGDAGGDDDDGGGSGTPIGGTYEYAQVIGTPATGYTLVDTPEPPGLSLGLVDAAGVESRLDVDTSGAFHGTLTAPGTYRLQFGTAGGFPLELQTTSAALAVRDPAVDRIVREPFSQATQVTCDLTGVSLDASSNRYGAIMSTGVRSFDSFSANLPLPPATFSVEWSTWLATDTRLAGALHATDDGLWCVHYVTRTHHGVVYREAADATELTTGLAAGQNITLPGSAGWHATPATACVAVTVAPSHDAPMLAVAMKQPASTAFTHATYFYSVPVLGLGLAGILPVALPIPSDTSDYTDTFLLASPFPNETLIGWEQLVMPRTYKVGGVTSLPASAGVNRVVAMPTGTCGGGPVANVDFSQQAAIPFTTAATLAGVTLANDSQPIAIDRTSAAGATMTFETAAPFDDAFVNLYDLTGAPLALAIRLSIHTTTASAQIDPHLLIAGHTYVMSVSARVGFPDARSGDFSRANLPLVSVATFLTSFVPN